MIFEFLILPYLIWLIVGFGAGFLLGYVRGRRRRMSA